MQSAIKITNLTKNFGKHIAVNDISIDINKGDIYGLIGRNGAGKTTLIKVLLGLLTKTSGEMEIFSSKDILKMRDKIGCIIENPGLFLNMTAKDNIIAQSKILGVFLSDEQIEDILNLVGLKDNIKKKAKNFSLGMKQRLAIAIALVGDPEILVLDEPTNGLDPEGISDIRNLILKLNKEKGITVLISSHILSELDKFATRYGVIDGGKLLKEFTEKELKEMKNENFEITVKKEDVKALEDYLNENNLKYKLDLENSKFLISSNIEKEKFLKDITLKDIIAISYGNVKYDLEEYFLEIIGGNKNE